MTHKMNQDKMSQALPSSHPPLQPLAMGMAEGGVGAGKAAAAGGPAPHGGKVCI